MTKVRNRSASNYWQIKAAGQECWLYARYVSNAKATGAFSWRWWVCQRVGAYIHIYIGMCVCVCQLWTRPTNHQSVVTVSAVVTDTSHGLQRQATLNCHSILPKEVNVDVDDKPTQINETTAAAAATTNAKTRTIAHSRSKSLCVNKTGNGFKGLCAAPCWHITIA